MSAGKYSYARWLVDDNYPKHTASTIPRRKHWCMVDRENKRPVVYVAGPFRGANSWEMEKNIRAAETLALQAWKVGFAVICPHANTRFFQGAAPDEIWLEGDLEILKRCDAVLLTPTWKSSKGAVAEAATAAELGIPVFESLSAMCAWFKDVIL